MIATKDARIGALKELILGKLEMIAAIRQEESQLRRKRERFIYQINEARAELDRLTND